ncbi:MAG: hypothetical protein ABIH65_03350 [Nanoarchaeota archaeon]
MENDEALSLEEIIQLSKKSLNWNRSEEHEEHRQKDILGDTYGSSTTRITFKTKIDNIEISIEKARSDVTFYFISAKRGEFDLGCYMDHDLIEKIEKRYNELEKPYQEKQKKENLKKIAKELEIEKKKKEELKKHIGYARQILKN